MSRPTDLMDKFCRDPRLGVSDQEFESLFCHRCRNQECTRANWGRDKFMQRVETQADRLLHPQQGDPEQYKNLVDFASMFQEAMRLEVSAARGDWSVPEFPVTDGKAVKAASSIDAAVEQAARALRNPRAGDQAEVPKEDQGVEVVDELNLVDDQADESPPVQAIEQEPYEPPRVAPPPPRTAPAASNVPRQDGMMVGGAEPPPKAEEKADPWSVPTTRTVKAGAVIRMGGNSDE